MAFGSSLASGISLASADTATLVVDAVVHPAGYDGAAAELSGFAVVDAASLDEVVDALPPVGTFEVRPTEVT